jgi:XTP/dITP diphosphohydrolase
VPKLLIASNNPGKVAEFRELLADCGWEVTAPADLGLEVEVDETGATYSENARLKAEAFARASGLASLGEDSGLEVDALDGAPGALHHLHGWDGGTQVETIALLLNALKDVPRDRRTAHYHATVVVVMPDGSALEESGDEEGLIIDTPAGSNGFGYDPVFFIPELGKTAAQLSLAEKNRVSHRAIATLKLKERLRALAAESIL